MNKIRQFIECFVTITTGILIIAAFVYPSQPEALTPLTLRQILLSAALCSLATVLFIPGENAGKIRIWIGIGLHFISLCAIMILCGRWFGWISPEFWPAFHMVMYVILVYGFTTGITYIMEKHQASELNDQLQQKYHASEIEENKKN